MFFYAIKRICLFLLLSGFLVYIMSRLLMLVYALFPALLENEMLLRGVIVLYVAISPFILLIALRLTAFLLEIREKRKNTMAISDFFRELFRKGKDEALEMEVITGFIEGAYTVAEVRKILAGEIPLKFSDKEDIRLKNLRSGVAKGFRAGHKLRKIMEFQERLEKGEFQEEEDAPDGRE